MLKPISALALLATLAAATPAAAGSLQIGPVRIQLIGPERTATISIRNTQDAPTNVQIRTVDWSQPEGADAYAPSSTLIASPPMFTLGPGETQVVRLVLRGLPDAPTERTFRVILDELPARSGAGGAGVQTALRALVPVFVTPSLQSRPSLSWTATRNGDALVITALNRGAARERLIDLRVTVNGQAVGPSLEGYVLSGARRSWTIAAAPVAASVSLSADGEYGAVSADVPVAP